MAEGRSNPAIGDAVFITKRAVEHHINNIFSKLEIREATDISPRVVAAITYLTNVND